MIISELKSPQYKYLNLISDFLSSNKTTRIKWLDLGCGNILLPKWIPEEILLYYKNVIYNPMLFLSGLDCKLSSLNKNFDIKNKVIGDIANLPFKSKSFDIITANMVVEHLENPEVLHEEIYRVLKLNGNFVFITPWKLYYLTLIASITPEHLKKKMIYYLVGREEKDIFPTYYRLNTVFKIKKLANKCSFKVKKIIRCEDDFYFFKNIPIISLLEVLFKKVMFFDCFKNLSSTLIVFLQKKNKK